MQELPARSNAWRWSVCGLMMFATLLMYMDRLTLNQLATRIKSETGITTDDYGTLEAVFGFAFAFGALFFGAVADRVSIRWLYPFVLVCWSAAGVAAAYANHVGATIASWFTPPSTEASVWYAPTDERGRIMLGLLACRVMLGFFEAGHWPCALVTTLRILPSEKRSLGNSILQSGASLGAILMPQIAKWMVTDEVGSWRGPFQVIGLIGIFWVVPWLLFVKSRDLELPDEQPVSPTKPDANATQTPNESDGNWTQFLLRYTALVFVVVSINATWHFFRAWLPSFLQEERGYAYAESQNIMSLYYVGTDVGCLAAGFAVTGLIRLGCSVHRSRMTVFLGCLGLTALSLWAVQLSRGPLLVGVLLLIGAGAIGFFPNYYAFTQELSKQRQGKVTGSFGFLAWMASGVMHKLVGEHVQQTKSYELGIRWAGLVPVAGFVAMLLLWNLAGRQRDKEPPAEKTET